MTSGKRNGADHGFNQWTINGVAFSMARMGLTLVAAGQALTAPYAQRR